MAVISFTDNGLLCEKSNLNLSISTKEPFCSIWLPKIFLKALCSRWVAEWFLVVSDLFVSSTIASTLSLILNSPDKHVPI